MKIPLFGLEISKIDKGEELSSPISVPVNVDGATDVSVTLGSSYFGVYVDTAGDSRSEYSAIQTYRQIAQYPEVDLALQDIINEAIPQEGESEQIKLDFSESEEYSDEFKQAISEEFRTVLNLFNYNHISSDIFRNWYVDGRIAYQVIVDKANLSNGIMELRPIDVIKLRKVREIKRDKTPMGVDAVTEVTEYFVFNDNGFAPQKTGTASSVGSLTSASSSSTQGLKISADAILYCTSGLVDVNGITPIGFLHKAIRPINQLRMLEDAMVVTRIARAPERRIFYIDVGSLPKGKAEQYVKDIMNQYRNKMVYDANTGAIRDDKKYMSMLEDFWLPRRDGGKGTEITTLPGAQNLDQIADTTYFKEKVYQSLNIPQSRMQTEDGFSMGRTTEITRDEVKFQKFIDKLRRRFSKIIIDALKTQLLLKGICNNIEWEELRQDIKLIFQSDNDFAEQKELDILQTRMALIPQVDQYLGKFFSKEWVQKNILRLTEEEVDTMDEQINNEKGDPTAQPSMMGMGGDPSMMGGQGGGDPYAQQDGQDAQGQDQQQPQGQPQQQYPFQ